MTRSAGLRSLAVCGLACAVVLALPWLPPFQESFRLTQLQAAAATVMIVLGLNFLTGYGGQISLGHSGFVLFGAYVAGILVTKGLFGQEVHPLLAILIAAGAGALLGFAIGLPALRLSGPYLVIVTLGLTLALPALLKWDPLSELTGGSTGLVLRQPRAPEALPWLSHAQWRYYFLAIPALLAGIGMWRLTTGRFGRALIALRDHELAAEQVGVHLARYKTTAFAISAAYASLGGALFSYASLGLVTPDTYGIFESLDYLTAIVIGGVGTINGSLIGAVLVAYQRQITLYLLAPTWDISFGGTHLASIPSPFALIDHPEPLRPALYGALLIAVVLLAPRGIAGALGDLLRSVRRRRGRTPVAPRWPRNLQAARTSRTLPDLRIRPDSDDSP